MNQPDIFGGETPIAFTTPGRPVVIPAYEKFKTDNNYRRSTNKLVRCKTCKNLTYNQFAKTYYKCRLIGTTGNPKTDIALRNVCDKWKFDD